MANYTIELREILRSKDIFKSINYELYNNDYKPIFEDKFIRKFYFREIGVETIQRFIINLESMLIEIMPYYTHLYKTTTYDYDPILNYDLNETITRTLLSEHNNKLNSNSRANTNQYDTPITKNDTYLKHPSNIVSGDDENTSSTEGKNNTNETNTRRTYGNIGVMTTQDMIKKERDIIINLDKLIFEELEILFMQVF